jgi:putative transposase
VSVVVAGANVHDKHLAEPTLEARTKLAPNPITGPRQNLCLDKGYDFRDIKKLVEDYGFTAHIRVKGEEPPPPSPHRRARRWVVERTHSWFNRFRRLLVRWEKKAGNYLGMIHFACALITWKATGLSG